jgi:nucleotide-binding universal stress UspA family protein
MLPFKKILYPVDYSPFCEVIVPYAEDMVRHFSARLILVHAYGPEALAYGRLPTTDPGAPEEVRIHEDRRLQDFAGANFPDQHVESFAEPGEAGTVIDKILSYAGVDLIMLPTHGRGRARRFLLGSGLVPYGVRLEATRVKADLIITGRGRNQTRQDRLWSNLYEIAREAPCPVLSI